MELASKMGRWDTPKEPSIDDILQEIDMWKKNIIESRSRRKWALGSESNRIDAMIEHAKQMLRDLYARNFHRLQFPDLDNPMTDLSDEEKEKWK
jgi:hypothetical protein|tara:strand:+ start:189 stop:470 length:282 start_codon:yes stop_codon:yes gene_type:complete